MAFVPDSGSAARIDALLVGTPLAGLGQTFVDAGVKHGVHPYLLVAIAKVESDYGRSGFATNGSRNAFGLGVTGAQGAGMRFSKWEEGIETAAATLGGPMYVGGGRDTISAIGQRWAQDPQWPQKVADAYPVKGARPSTNVSLDAGDIGGAIVGGATAVGGAVADVAMGPVRAVLDFVARYALKLAAFLLLGVVGVFLVSQGASRAFGTPTVGQAARAVKNAPTYPLP